MAEKVLSNVARGIISSVVGPLAAKEIRLFGGVEEELEKLKSTVSTIEVMLLDAEQQQAKSQAVRDWLGKLTNILYEADDFLDAVSAKALRQKIMTHDKKAKKVRILSNQLTFDLKMAHKIRKIRGKLVAISAERNFHLEVRHVETRVAGSDSYFRLGVEEVIGREDDKKAVIERLDAKVKGNVSILAIVGSGGLGKITLAQLIFNDEKFTEKFELKMWVHVSDDFDFKIMVEKILQSAIKHGPKTNVVDTLVDQLRKEIHEKKYLLVLDNVSNEVHGRWSELKKSVDVWW